MEDAVELYAIIEGQVQGVGFRYTTEGMARKFGIFGTVRNVPDGTVELLAQGPRPQIEALLSCLQGPRGPGHIEAIDSDWRPIAVAHTTFKIIS